jgi:hypothetical protein
MPVRKFGLILSIVVSGQAYGEIDINLFEPTTILVISRSSGIVQEKLITPEQHVDNGDEILTLYTEEKHNSVVATSNGVLREYADSVQEGNIIQEGDIVAILVSEKTKGVLIPQNEEALPSTLKVGDIYCCLNIEHNEFDIDIQSITQINHQMVYYFAVENTPSLTRLLQSKEDAKQELNISFEINSKQENTLLPTTDAIETLH